MFGPAGAAATLRAAVRTGWRPPFSLRAASTNFAKPLRSFFALAAAPGPAHVLDQGARRGAGRRVVVVPVTVTVPDDEGVQAGVAAGHGLQGPDGGAGAAQGGPFGGHLVDEGDTRLGNGG